MATSGNKIKPTAASLRSVYDAEARALHGPQVGLGVYAVRRAWVFKAGC